MSFTLNNLSALVPRLHARTLGKVGAAAAAGRGRRSLYVRQLPPPPAEQLPAVERVAVDWSCVERLLPRRTVPTPTPKQHYPSGWRPQREDLSLPYSVKRSVNHQLPVYLQLRDSGVQRLTYVIHVRGDIWKMHEELKRHLEATTGRYIASQVQEPAQSIRFRGDLVDPIKRWMLERGL